MAPTEKAFVAQPVTTGGGRVISSPFQFYTTGEDSLRILSANSVAGVTLKIQARFVDSFGKIQANSWDHTPNADRSIAATEFEMGVGALLNLTVFAGSGAPMIGQTFVIVQLIRGSGVAAIVLGTLLQGYVTTQQAIGWPGSPIVSSTDGEPAIRTILGTAPAAGVEISETVPTGARWRLISLTARLQTAIGGANRIPYLFFSTGVGTFGVYPQVGSTPANNVAYQTWGAGVPAVVAPGFDDTSTGIPETHVLPAGSSVRTVTNNIQAGDQYTAPAYSVQEWLEVN